MTGTAFAISLHKSAASIEAEWRHMEADGAVTAFQRFDFVAPLYAAFAAHGRAEPMIVLVRTVDSGRPAMILPLSRHQNGGRIITFADLRVADYCAPVLARGFSPDAATFRALWRQIESALPAADIVHLRKLPATVGGRPNPLLWLRPRAAFPVHAHGVAIAHPWHQHASGAISKKQLGELRRSESNLGRLGTLGFAFHDGGAAAVALFEDLYAQRTARFAALGRDDVLADPMWAAFYRDLVVGGTAQPAARMMGLTLDGTFIASGLGLVHDGAFLLLIPSFDMQRYARFGLGRLQIYRAMQAFAEDGLTYFDLTIGDEPYKSAFGVDDRTLFEVLRPLSPRGLGLAAVWHAKVLLRRFPTLRERLRRWTGRA